MTSTTSRPAAGIAPPIAYGTRMLLAGTGEALVIVRPALRKKSDRASWARIFDEGWNLVQFAHGGRLCVHISSLAIA